MKKYFLLVIVGLILITSPSAKAFDKSEGAPLADSADKLIAKNVEYPSPLWCGAEGSKLIYTADYADIYSYDLKDHKKQLIKEHQAMLMACPSNGSRIIYLDLKGTYYDDDREADSIGVWSFDLDSYAHKLIAVVYANDILAPGNNIISPDGKTMLLGRRPAKATKTDDGMPRIIWNNDR